MKAIIVVIAALSMSAAAYAQDKPPMVGDKPLTQIKPRGAKAAKAAKPDSVATQMGACLEIEDGSKERLDCYDAIIPPKPVAGKRKPAAAKSATDCRLIKEQDERLTCFNGFASKLPKPAG